MTRRAAFILGDWGSTRLRLWFVAEGSVRAKADGAGLLVSNRAPEEELGAVIAALGDVAGSARVVLCGMAGARGGLAEAGYVPCPAGIGEWREAARELRACGRDCTILPGFSFRAENGRPDVMRGEETQLFGAMSVLPSLARGTATVVLPGTHSKWTRIKDGEITRFSTCFTGELRARLIGSSLVPQTAGAQGEQFDEGFRHGLGRASERSPLLQALFEGRSAQLVDHRSADWASGFLSGLLIGAEIAGMNGEGFAGDVLLVGGRALCDLYAAAFAEFGMGSETLDGDECVLKGLELACADA